MLRLFRKHFPANSSPPVPEIGVVGCGFYTSTVLDLLTTTGQPARFLVNHRVGPEADPFGTAHAAAERGIPVISPAEFAARMRVRPDTILYTGWIESNTSPGPATDPHTILSEWVATTVGTRIALRHPVELAGRTSAPPCSQRYAVFGYVGSGNVLTQSLISGLIERHPEPPTTAWQMRSGLSEHYFHSVATRIRHSVAKLSPTAVGFVPYDFGTMVVTVECGPDRGCSAFSVPCLRHLGFRTYPTHSRPTRQAIDHFEAAGVPCVVVVRHPLETILSQTNKILRPARILFDDPDFLSDLGEGIAEWMSQLLQNRTRVFVSRYEDLFERRVPALRNLAAYLGQSLTDAEAEMLFDRYLNRNLPAEVPSHFYRGGSDKWRSEFQPDHLRRVMKKIPPELFTTFGYAVPTESDLVPTQEPKTAAPTKRPSSLQASNIARKTHTFVPGRHGIHITGNDPELKAALFATFQNPELLAFFDAGGLTKPISAPWPEDLPRFKSAG